MMDQLKQRQQEVLGMIVDTYVKTINPVGSRTIARHFREELSPATIRNEMQDLEALDYITHPHTSAGRVPTNKGYRYYVDHLLSSPGIDPRHAEWINQELLKQIDNVETLIERTSKILSTLSEYAAIVSFPSFEELILKRVELTPIGRQSVLIVWVAENGFVQDRVIDMHEELLEEDIEHLNRFLNQELKGILLSGVKTYLARKLEEAHDSLRVLYETAQKVVSAGFPELSRKRICVEGVHQVLAQPEFQNWEKTKRFLKVFDEKDSLSNLVEISPRSSGLRIQIGAEHRCEDIWDCSVVSTEYFINRKPAGTLGILGPRRMSYARAAALVMYMAQRFDEIWEEW